METRGTLILLSTGTVGCLASLLVAFRASELARLLYNGLEKLTPSMPLGEKGSMVRVVETSAL